MKGPQKHSLTLRGHRTSVTLEPEFWDAFRQMAAARDVALNELAASIDADRGEVNLASAIRVHVLRWLRSAQTAEERDMLQQKERKGRE